MVARLRVEDFGTTAAGVPIERYVLDHDQIQVALLTWGATVQSLLVVGSDGVLDDVVLGFDDLAGYVDEHPYFGAVVGRYANRIANGRFNLDGTDVQIPTNDRGHALHGGPDGFHRQVWSAQPLESADGPAVEFSYLSPDASMGFPGNLDTTVTYTLQGTELRIDYRARTDRPTVVNLTQHSYFNLAGPQGGSIESHELEIPASRYLPMDAGSIPLAEVATVEGTPFDFRRAKPVGRDLDCPDEQLGRGLGYDHSWLLDGPYEPLAVAGRLSDPGSGRVLEVRTDEPAVQFYSGNQLDATLHGKAGRVYGRRDGLCLETQHLPDSPNRSDFPSVALRPGDEYTSTTLWRFSTL